MKEAQEFRAGNIAKINNQLMVVQKATFNKGGRNAATIAFKFKNLETGGSSEVVYRATDKLDDVVLDRREMEYLYNDGDMFIFMDKESYEQISVTDELIGEYMNYMKEQIQVEMSFYEGRPVGMEFPTFVTGEITYTEPAVRGDTSGKVMKKAKIDDKFELDVPAFCNEGDKIKIDTRTHEYSERVK